MTLMSLQQLEQRVEQVFRAAGTSEKAARSVAQALVLAEADGQKGHGLSRIASYRGQAASGKVDGFAVPVMSQPAAACLLVDARCGFAYPALDKAEEALAVLASETGIAAAAIAHSHHAGVAGHTVEALARAGMIGMMFANSPGAIAPTGGRSAIFGTNPIAFACPRLDGADPLVIDLSLSKVARGKVMVAAQKGEPIPEGWALDADGHPTSDAKAALTGTMLPMGEAKGAALVMMVEILATALTGSLMGYEASSFFETEGTPPRVGQFLIAIHPSAFGHQHTLARIEALISTIAQDGETRIPGMRRFALRHKAVAEGITVDDAMLTQWNGWTA